MLAGTHIYIHINKAAGEDVAHLYFTDLGPGALAAKAFHASWYLAYVGAQ